MATKTKRRLSATAPPQYNSEVHGKFQGGSPPDDHTINEKVCAVRLVRPRYKEGPLFYRPFPQPSYDDPTTLAPGRKSPDPDSYSHWHVSIEGASYIGAPGGINHSFLLYPPFAPKEQKNLNPYRVFYKACKAAHEGDQHGSSHLWQQQWNKLMKGGKAGGAAIGKSTRFYFAQGAVFASGDDVYINEDRNKPLGLGPDDALTIIQTKSSGGRAMVDLFNQRLEDFDGDEEVDLSCGFTFGDPIGKLKTTEEGKLKVVGGWIIEVFNPKKTKHKPALNCSYDGKAKDIAGYEVMLHKQIELNQLVCKASLSPADVERILEISRWWFDDDEGNPGILYFPPVEEQCVWIAQAFQGVSGLLKFAWYEHSEFMSDDVKTILKARKSSVVPGQEDADDDDTENAGAAAGKKKRRTDPVLAGKKRAADEDEDEDEDEDDDDEEEETPAPKKKKAKPAADEDDDDEDGDDEEETPAPKKKAKPAADDDDDDDDEEEETPAPKKKAKPVADDDDDDDDDDDEEETPAPKKKKAKPAAAADDDEDDEDEEEAAPTPKKKAKPAADDDDEDEDDEEEETPAPKKKKAKPAVDDDDDDDEDEEEDGDTPPPLHPKKPTAAPAKARKAGKNGDEFADSLETVEAAKRKSAKRGAVATPAPKVKPKGPATAPAKKKK